MTTPSTRKLLVANRGEIACRILRTARSLGFETIAVFSEADRNAVHTREADYAVLLGEPEAKDSYLNIKKIIAVALEHGVQLIHPGYGFLSESAPFAQACEVAGITFIGPRAAMIEQFGSKVNAKALASSLNISTLRSITLPQHAHSDQEINALLDAYLQHQCFPLLVKAAAGGGGRGMRRLLSREAALTEIRNAAREAETFFGAGDLFLEPLVEPARHIEVQIAGDRSGEVCALGLRDCSVQRRHQKIIEEAPPTALDPRVAEALLKSAELLAKTGGYLNLGTVEFLVDSNGAFFFLEVNSRLQVEHPVTEAVTAIDLVKLQIELAEGRLLKDLNLGTRPTITGHALECRICAESVEREFAASTGTVANFEVESPPSSLRIDSGIARYSKVSHYYDSLLAKFIVRESTREAARISMIRALKSTQLSGIRTNIPYLLDLLEDPTFIEGSFSVRSADAVAVNTNKKFYENLSVQAALAYIVQFNLFKGVADEPWLGVEWRDSASYPLEFRPISLLDQLLTVRLRKRSGILFSFEVSGVGESLQAVELRVTQTTRNKLSFRTAHNHLWHEVSWHFSHSREISFSGEFGPFVAEFPYASNTPETSPLQGGNSQIKSPLPGKVVSLSITEGTLVKTGETLFTLESMKMEHLIKSTSCGMIRELKVSSGSIVKAGELLCVVETADSK